MIRRSVIKKSSPKSSAIQNHRCPGVVAGGLCGVYSETVLEEEEEEEATVEKKHTSGGRLLC